MEHKHCDQWNKKNRIVSNIDVKHYVRYVKNNEDIKIKMAFILPTGQWYALSAVINDAWYCMVLHNIS